MKQAIVVEHVIIEVQSNFNENRINKQELPAGVKKK
jgi:hypothetical protein